MLPAHTYHVYNHANGGDNLFREPTNFDYFHRKWKRYVDPLATTFAFCYMPNHFHVMLEVKRREHLLEVMINLGKFNLDHVPTLNGTIKPFTLGDLISILKDEKDSTIDIECLDQQVSRFVIQQFSNLFNGYTKAVNKMYRRYGSLFAPRFRRIPVMTEDYARKLIAYIHRNPVHHHFCKSMDQWGYSSFNLYKDVGDHWSNLPISRYFGTYEDFIKCHKLEESSKGFS